MLCGWWLSESQPDGGIGESVDACHPRRDAGPPMKFLVHVKGPSDPGPGERTQMLDRAAAVLDDAGIEPADVVRIDVPGRGASEEGDGSLRSELEPIVPTLQSGSLFGGTQGLLVVDAQGIRASEATVIAELLGLADENAVRVVLVSGGAIPAALTKAVKEVGETITVKKMRDRDASDWLGGELRSRKMSLSKEATTALLDRFGVDIGSLGQALDRLQSVDQEITADLIRDQFRNRPDEPMWRIGDSIAAGNVSEALRRLRDFLTHTHPLVLLAFLENDVKRRALAAAAPDIETFARWVNGKPDAFPIKKAWRARGAVSDTDLRRAIDAFVRADATLKTAPEETHRITLERLTVALCRWYG